VDTIQGIVDAVEEEVERIGHLAETEDLHGDAREGALDVLLQLRANLEEAPTELPEALDDELEIALDDIDNILEELELFDSLDAPELNDLLHLDVDAAISRPVGMAMRARVQEFIEESIPPREALRAIDDIVDPEFEDVEEETLEEAESIGMDHLLHDWRWAEGSGIIARFRDENPELDADELTALTVLEMSHFDVFRVDDVDIERSTVHLERIADNTTIHVELDEDLDDVMQPGDAMIARIYMWGDGAQLGTCLPIEESSVNFLEEWIDELAQDEHPPPIPTSRNGLFKAWGHLICVEILFPDSAED
jgi:hypothetical protein